MSETVYISREDWDGLVVTRSVTNATAREEVERMARMPCLLIRDHGGDCYWPLEGGAGWSLVKVWSDRDVASKLGIKSNDAMTLLSRTEVRPVGVIRHLFVDEKYFSVDEIAAGIKGLARARGMDEFRAALELGIKFECFGLIASRIEYSSEGRYLREFLEKYRNSFLPRHTVWSSRSTLLMDFIDEYNSRNVGKEQLVPQRCDVDACGHIASDQCCNPVCRTSERARYVCPMHEVWINDGQISNKPACICPVCAELARAGRLPYKLL